MCFWGRSLSPFLFLFITCIFCVLTPVKPNAKSSCVIKEVPAFEMAKSSCDKEGEEKRIVVRVGESPNIGLGPKEKKHRRSALALWPSPGRSHCSYGVLLPSTPTLQAGNDTDHEMHLGAANVGLPPSGSSVWKMLHLPLSQLWTQLSLLAAMGVGDAVPLRASPVNARPCCSRGRCQPGLAAL